MTTNNTKKFIEVAAMEINSNNWSQLIERAQSIYKRKDDPRSEFNRDYNRILHCRAYRRLKHKTQVFFAPENDHVCTRIEHVNHVTSISNTIASALGLNTELTNAIAIGHDIGHSPFGHEGEKILKKISRSRLKQPFWHEKNSLWFADNIETITDEQNLYQNLNLTYAVRDGLICHCGEVDDESISPRPDWIDLNQITKPSEVHPYTWEGCVVKIADKIAYLGRDIEDALMLGVITTKQFYRELYQRFPGFNREHLSSHSKEINNTTLIHSFIINLCELSEPDQGLKFSDWHLEFMKSLRTISNDLIYENKMLKYSKFRVKLIIESIFDVLISTYYKPLELRHIRDNLIRYPLLQNDFVEWLVKYSDISTELKINSKYRNKQVYRANIKRDYIKAICDYIAAMTDNYAIRVFNELTRFS